MKPKSLNIFAVQSEVKRKYIEQHMLQKVNLMEHHYTIESGFCGINYLMASNPCIFHVLSVFGNCSS